MKNCDIRLNAVNAQDIEVSGCIDLNFKFGSRTFNHRAIICEAISYPGAILVGFDLIKRLGIITLDFHRNQIKIMNMSYDICPTTDSYSSFAVRSVKKQKTHVKSKYVRVSQPEKILPKMVAIISAKVPYYNGTLVQVDGKDIGENIRIANSVATVRKGQIPISIANLSENELRLSKRNEITTVCPVKPNGDECEFVEEQPNPVMPNLSHLSDEKSNEIKNILTERKNAISQHKKDIGYCSLVEHEIKTGDHLPIATRQWPQPHSTRQAIKAQCDEMMEMDVIEKSSSPWHSPSLLVKKKNGSYRYCIDFRKINEISEKDKYPLPHIDNVLESLKGAKYFSTLDLRSGYWQISVAEKDRDKTAFSCMGETYRFKRLPFGLHNGPATFQRLMQQILFPIIGNCAYCFLDDIIIFSDSFQKHAQDLNQTLSLLEKAGLKVSLEKCMFAQNSIKYLGHVVSEDGIQVDPEKVEAVKEMQEPKTVKQVRRFIGMSSYYRRFVPNFSTIAAPLTELTRKNTKFVWTQKHQEAFEKLKTSLINTPILCYPDYSKMFQIHCDASDIALGSVLMQKDEDGIDHPVSYFSRKFNNAEINYTVTEKEALAIVESVKHYSQYVYGYHFQIYTDHAPLRYLFQYKTTIPRITRWAVLLSEFDYEMIYKPGKDNIIPDTLSRNVANVNITSRLDPADVFNPTQVRKEQASDDNLKKIIECLECGDISSLDPEIVEKYVLQQECLYLIEHANEEESNDTKLRLVVPKSMIKHALKLSHDSTLGGHYGFNKTSYRCRSMFYWPNQVKDIKEYISHCVLCQKRNFHGILQGKIGSLPPVTRPLERIGVDLIGKISPSLSNNHYILTIVCHFTRFVQAYSLPDKKAETVATEFLDYVCRYGCPEHIVSDRGSEFTAEIFKEIARQMKAKLHLTTSFHPQSNGLTESFNKLLKNTLHSLVQNDVKTWDEQLPCSVLALNCSYHPSIKNVPYTLFHGREPPIQYSELLKTSVLNYSLEDGTPKSLFARLQKAFNDAAEASREAHELNVKYRRPKVVVLNEGDTVFLKNDAAVRGPYSKFQPRWLGPFFIVRKISELNYEIKPLGEKGRKQVVHINRLKPAKLRESEPFLGMVSSSRPETVIKSVPGKNRDKETVEEVNESDDSDDSSDGEGVCVRKLTKVIRRKDTQKYQLRSRGPIVNNTELPKRTRKKRNVNALTFLLSILALFYFSV